MKLLHFFLALVIASSTFFSCDFDKSVNKTSLNEPLEIEFEKEGELNLLNQDKVIKALDIEIASDDYERQNGLMYRSKMDENKGMLFLFNSPKIQNFWMKNTRMPLDIIYISEAKEVINIAENTVPFKESGVPSSQKPAKYVLEVNGGSSDKWGIIPGITKIEFKTLK